MITANATTDHNGRISYRDSDSFKSAGSLSDLIGDMASIHTEKTTRRVKLKMTLDGAYWGDSSLISQHYHPDHPILRSKAGMAIESIAYKLLINKVAELIDISSIYVNHKIKGYSIDVCYCSSKLKIHCSDAGKGRILVFMDGVRRLNTDKMIRDIIAAKKEFIEPRLGVVPVCKVDQEFMALHS